jgi:hypothetical protein
MTRSLKIGVISKKEHAKQTKRVLEQDGHEVILLGGNLRGKVIPPSCDVLLLRTCSASHDADSQVRKALRDETDPRVVIHAKSVSEARRKVAALANPPEPEEVQPQPQPQEEQMQTPNATTAVKDVLRHVGIVWSRADLTCARDFLTIAREIGFGLTNFSTASAAAQNLWSFSSSQGANGSRGLGRAVRTVREQNVDSEGLVSEDAPYHETCFTAVPAGRGRSFVVVVLTTRALTDAEKQHLMGRLQTLENTKSSPPQLHLETPRGVNMTNESRAPMHTSCESYRAYYHKGSGTWNVRTAGPNRRTVPGYASLPNRASVLRAFKELLANDEAAATPAPAPEPKRRPAPPSGSTSATPVPARTVGERSPMAEADAMVRVGILYAELRAAMREAAILEFEGGDGGVVVIPALTHFRFRSMHGCSVAGDESSTITRAASEVTCPSCIETLKEIGLWS